MKQFFKSKEKLWVPLIIVVFAVLLVTPQLFTRKVILGSDSVFHYNRFYEAAMQLKNGNFSYFLSLYGFQQSGRIVNALYGPFFCLFTRRTCFNKWHLVSLSDCVEDTTTYIS